MKITILQGAFLPVPPVLGGAVEKIWFRMGHEFAKKGHEVVHISKKHEGFLDEEIYKGVCYIRTKGYLNTKSLIKLKILDLFYTYNAIKKIPKDSDIIVTNTFWAPLLIKKRDRKKIYVSVERFPRKQMKFYTRSGCLRGNSTPVSDAIRSEIQQKYHYKVEMVPNPLPFDSESDWNINEKRKVVLYVGRIHPEKGLHLLVSAFQNIKNDWELRIVGPYDVNAGGGGDEYYQYLKSINASENIIFVGPLFDMDKLKSEYIHASLFVYPSLAERGETFGLAPLEAMAFGCVPIVSDLDCFKDFIRHDINGIVFNHRVDDSAKELGESIKSLIDNDMIISKLATKAIEVNKSHSSETIAQSFIQSFKKMIYDYS